MLLHVCLVFVCSPAANNLLHPATTHTGYFSTVCIILLLLLYCTGVTGLDMCVRRPLLATCSTDRTVRLWNYNERTCELCKTFNEEAHSIAIHPTGLMLLVRTAGL